MRQDPNRVMGSLLLGQFHAKRTWQWTFMSGTHNPPDCCYVWLKHRDKLLSLQLTLQFRFSQTNRTCVILTCQCYRKSTPSLNHFLWISLIYSVYDSVTEEIALQWTNLKKELGNRIMSWQITLSTTFSGSKDYLSQPLSCKESFPHIFKVGWWPL